MRLGRSGSPAMITGKDHPQSEADRHYRDRYQHFIPTTSAIRGTESNSEVEGGGGGA